MRPYADVPSRRMLQILADVIAVLAILMSVRTGIAVHDKIASFAVWGERISAAGERLGTSLTNIGETLGGIPLIGGLISDPFTNASKAAEEWEKVGADIQTQIGSLAVSIGIGVAIGPIVFILLIWLIPRLRFAVRAARVRNVAMSAPGLDLLALRALASAPVKDLQRISPDVAEAWRNRDEPTIRALATLSLQRAGVKIPVAKTQATPEAPAPAAPTPPPPAVAAAPRRVIVTDPPPPASASSKPATKAATSTKPASSAKPASTSASKAPKKPS